MRMHHSGAGHTAGEIGSADEQADDGADSGGSSERARIGIAPMVGDTQNGLVLFGEGARPPDNRAPYRDAPLRKPGGREGGNGQARVGL